MKIYLVGGAVRDKLMGVEPKDLDYVVVGSTPEEMISLGYTQVGADFPVFLHPETKDEYALARTERKSGTGHTGFDCEWEGVTLKEDLSRRDLTINSMAQCLETGNIIDPFGGRYDIQDKILRHTTGAFKEDPLRVLRVARFFARFGKEWQIHLDTAGLMLDMADSGELDSLTKERVWKEMDKALATQTPSIFFSTMQLLDLLPELTELNNCGQREDHHPEGDVGTHTLMTMDYAAKTYMSPQTIFACLCHDFGKPVSMEKYGTAHGHEKAGLPLVEAFCDKWKVPNRYRRIAMMTCEHHTKVHGILGRNNQKATTPKSIMKLFEATNALNKGIDFNMMLDACESDAAGRGATPEQIKQFEDASYPQADYLLECLDAVHQVDTKSISKQLLSNGKDGIIIGLEIRAARINAIRGVRKKWLQNSK